MQRNMVIDSARALAMLYIVGYWHLFNYTKAFPGYYNSYTYCLTTITLAVFTFLSGYLLSQKNEIDSIASLVRFYTKRFLRIYPLYILAITSFGLIGFYKMPELFKPLFGLTVFVEPQIMTLWFMTMLLFFYALTPLFLFSFRKQCFALTALFVAILLAIYQVKYDTLETRVFIYYPVFIYGIWFGKTKSIDDALKHWPTLIIASLVLYFGYHLARTNFPAYVKEIPLAIGGTIIFLFFAKLATYVIPSKALYWFSYASFSIYLFHRVIFTLCLRTYHPEALNAQVIYLYAVLLPLVCITSFMIQFGYDWIYKKISGFIVGKQEASSN